jgi:hypothetical protein
MAIRYSGSLRITVRYVDGAWTAAGFVRDHYRCSVTNPETGERSGVMEIYPAPAGFGRGVAYDSPEAYDVMARSAVSFATCGGEDGPARVSSDAAEHGERDVIVTRSAPASGRVAA